MNFKTHIAVFIVLNIALVAWLLFRCDPSRIANTEEMANELLSAPTLSESRYDIQDRSSELNIIHH